MAAYRLVDDSRHLQADCQEPGSAPEHYINFLFSPVAVPFYFSSIVKLRLSTFVLINEYEYPAFGLGSSEILIVGKCSQLS